MKHTFEITVEVDDNWINYLMNAPDIFAQVRAGYWLRGVENHPKRGWLCWEDYSEGDLKRFGFEPDRNNALEAWEAGTPLPKGWYRLDKAAALRAWEEGVKRWGVDWYEDVDGTREDVVVQLALLEEIKYG